MKRVSSIAPQPECQSALWLHRSDQQQFCSRSCRGEVPPGGRAWATGLPPRNRLLHLGLFDGDSPAEWSQMVQHYLAPTGRAQRVTLTPTTPLQ